MIWKYPYTNEGEPPRKKGRFESSETKKQLTDRDKANKYVNKYMDVCISSQSFSIILHLRITSHKC